MKISLFKKRLSSTAKIFIAALLALALTLGYTDTIKIVLKRFENRSIDYRFLIRGTKPLDESVPVVLVYIDNDSAMEYKYRSPTPRKLLADLVDQLDAKGAKVIGIDVLLDESYFDEEDAILEQAFVRSGKKIVLVTQLKEQETAGSGYEHVGVLDRFARLTHQGFAVSKSEGDDFHRWVNVGTYENQVPFAIKIANLFMGREIELPEALIRNQKDPWILVDFLGPPSRLTNEINHFNCVSASEVPFVPDFYFKDKIVLIGSAIEDLGDTFLIPFSTQQNKYLPMFGVEFHAILLRMIFKNSFLFELTPLQIGSLTFLFFWMISLMFLFLKPAFALIALPVSVMAWSSLSVYVFLHYARIFPIAYPVFALIIEFILCQWLIHITEVRHSRFLKNTFQHYISPQLVEELVTKQEEVSLGGKKEDLSIFFSDLKGFTTISEERGADILIDFLHLYFEEMTKILFKEHGTLDKYIGDAVMAFYGAPNPLPDHAVHACRSAIMMQKRIQELNKNPIEKWLQVEARIGINSGLVIVGNSGSKTRFNYTVIGDAVNLASRLEGTNKLFGTLILISEFTLQRLQEQIPDDLNPSRFFTRELGKFIVKGKLKPVAVHELVDFEENITDDHRIIKQEYETALHAFYHKEFGEAQAIFTRLKNETGDQASEFLLRQVNHFKLNPPDETWAGEIMLLTK